MFNFNFFGFCSDHDSVISNHTEKGQTLVILDLTPGANYSPEPILRYTITLHLELTIFLNLFSCIL